MAKETTFSVTLDAETSERLVELNNRMGWELHEVVGFAIGWMLSRQDVLDEMTKPSRQAQALVEILAKRCVEAERGKSK